jgi:RNA polymerase sigma factor (TIGR02999 family)
VPETGDITRLLQHWKNGQAEAFDALLPLVYPDLKRIAYGCLRAERPGHTLQATALVHELYLRLCQQREANWEDRRHFYTFAAKVMRRILTDHARRANAAKRDRAGNVSLNEEILSVEARAAGPRDFGVDVGGPEYLDLEMAMDELEKIDARKTRVVELCHLIGCSVNEAADILQISLATAERDLKFARGWLYQRLRP